MRSRSSIGARFVAATDAVLPESLREHRGEALMRGRLLVWLSLLALALPFVNLWHALSTGEARLCLLAVAGTLIQVLVPWSLKWWGLSRAVHLQLALNLVYLTVMVARSGPRLPHLYLPLTMLPLAALIVAGWRASVPWLVLVIADLLVLRAMLPPDRALVAVGLSATIAVAVGLWIIALCHESLRAHAQEETERARREAERAARMKGEFLANMSHELRTPMHGVIGLTELLLETGLDERQRGYALTVREAASSLLVILNDILDLSKIEAGKLALEAVPIDVAGEAELVARLLRHQAEAKGLSLDVSVRPMSPPAVLGDPTRLRQILVNLVGNAVKFTERGRVSLCVDVGELRDGVHEVVLTVADTGVGIPPERRAELFQKFSQLDASLLRRARGTGLGLSITDRLVRLMGGRIDLDSVPGQGSRFTIRLPLPRAEALPETPEVPVKVDGGGARALVVDDTPASLLLMQKLLEARNLRVTTASDGKAALEAFEPGAFALVFMDCHMPELDGFDATRAIREREEDRGTVIVALTASALDEDRERCLAAGMDDFLAKPFRREELDLLLGRHLGSKSDAA